MFSGAYPHVLVDDVAFEVEGKTVPKRSGGDVDIGCGSAFGGAAEDDSALDDPSVEYVINLVDGHRLQETSMPDKKGFMTWAKTYMARVKTALEATDPARVPAFMKGAACFVKRILENFSDFDFYTNESFDDTAGLALRFYKADGVIPYFYFFRDGLVLSFSGFGKSVAAEALVPHATALQQGFIR